jgi:hypothetical protein
MRAARWDVKPFGLHACPIGLEATGFRFSNG